MSSSTMALARAFTKRTKRNNDPPSPGRSNTVRYTPGTINRNKISLPTELISTTNVHALTAPDIRKIPSNSSSSSLNSGTDSDFSTIDRSFLNRVGNDDSSIDSAPLTPITPMDDVSSFFGGKTSETPAIPQRAPSHSKKAHVELSRKRSIQRMSPPPSTLTKPAMRNSVDLFNPASTSDSAHPFGRELAQVNEVAEEFGATRAILEEEEQDLLNRGLCKFGVEDYLDEIAGIYGGGVFEDKLGLNPWI